MKTVKILFAAIGLSLLTVGSLQAGNAELKRSAENQLREKLTNVFKSAPFESIMGTENATTMIVTFKIDANAKLTNYKIEGGSETLQRYAYRKLAKLDLSANPALANSYYNVKITFEAR